MTPARPQPSALIIVPCLNEALHIESLLDVLRPSAERLSAYIAVVDGGSTDGTPAIVARYAKHHPRIVLLQNSKRLQSAAINHVVRTFGRRFDYFIRLDAHARYPEDYCDRLVEEALVTGADSVVVSMVTEGAGLIQSATAAAQNSKLGTGGAKHRHLQEGRWIDHGHHALMRVSAFLAIGGYDETFGHNEDAELDCRLEKNGYMVWLTNRTHMTYFPRSSFGKLYLQYLGYGRGRARNLLKHKGFPKLRQLVPLSVFPSVVIAAGALLHRMGSDGFWFEIALLLPATLWALVCTAFGLHLAITSGSLRMGVGTISAAIMHFAWSLGFWLQLVGLGPRHRKAAG